MKIENIHMLRFINLLVISAHRNGGLCLEPLGWYSCFNVCLRAILWSYCSIDGKELRTKQQMEFKILIASWDVSL